MFVAYLFFSRLGMLKLGNLLQQRNKYFQCSSPWCSEGKLLIVDISISEEVQGIWQPYGFTAFYVFHRNNLIIHQTSCFVRYGFFIWDFSYVDHAMSISKNENYWQKFNTHKPTCLWIGNSSSLLEVVICSLILYHWLWYYHLCILPISVLPPLLDSLWYYADLWLIPVITTLELKVVLFVHQW